MLVDRSIEGTVNISTHTIPTLSVITTLQRDHHRRAPRPPALSSAVGPAGAVSGINFGAVPDYVVLLFYQYSVSNVVCNTYNSPPPPKKHLNTGAKGFPAARSLPLHRPG